jgi:hypothetical protein
MPGGGLDFTGRNATAKYVEEAFGENTPILNVLTFKVCTLVTM